MSKALVFEPWKARQVREKGCARNKRETGEGSADGSGRLNAGGASILLCLRILSSVRLAGWPERAISLMVLGVALSTASEVTLVVLAAELGTSCLVNDFEEVVREFGEVALDVG